MNSYLINITSEGLRERDLRELFDSVNLETETSSNILIKAFSNASHISYITFDDKLIAIARSMDDDCWNANIDCVVVHKDYHYKGVGTLLMNNLLEQLRNVPCISLSPNFKSVKGFYEKFGFKEVETGCLLQLIKEVT